MESQKRSRVGRKKVKAIRPWLKPDGSEIPTRELREIAKTWDHAMWAAYLKWYESPLREKHVHPYRYDLQLDELRESMFAGMDQSTKQTKVSLCQRLLANLPEHQQSILKFHFFAGLPYVEIGPRIGRSKQSVHRQRNQALESLKRGIYGDTRDKCQFMRTKKISNPRFWDQNITFFLKENRSYERDEEAAAFAAITPVDLRDSILSLSPRVRRALFLRYWCGCSFAEIGFELDMGHNTLSALLESAVASLKRNFMNFQLNFLPGDRSPYGAE